MMKILFIARGPSPYRVEFFNELGKYCNLTVAFELHPNEIDNRDKSWGSEDFRNFEAIYLKKSLRIGNNNICFNVIKYISNREYDHIIIGMYSTITQILAIIYLKFKRRSYILNSDGGFIKTENNIKYMLKRFLISGADLYLASSKGTADYLKYYGASNNIGIYPFTTTLRKDLPNSKPSINEKNEIKESLGIPLDKNIIISVGQFINRKGFDTLIKAVSYLDDSYYVYIIGGLITNEYKRLCDDYKLKNIEFLEFKSKHEISQYYKMTDLFILPTREDIWGLVINEAMSYGVPVITTTKCLAGTELIKDDINGYIIEPNDEIMLSKKIKHIFSDCKKMDYMGCNNLDKMKLYTIENMAYKHYCILKNGVIKDENE